MDRIISLLFIALFVAGCGPSVSNDKGAVIARVYDDYLYEYDLKDLIPENASMRDSISFVKAYTDNWVKTRLMIYQAEKNLTIQRLNFEKQLEDYKNSLIIYHYETELINQKLDTLVTDAEIEQYYFEHLSDFELKENIAKVQYVILNNEDEIQDEFIDLFKLPDTLLLDSLEFYSQNYAVSYFLDTVNWFRFNELQEIIPIETYNQELFLKGHRFITLTDDHYFYLVNFVDFKIKDDTSPLNFEKNDIRNIIINKRKIALIKQVRKDLFDKAVMNKDFDIYYKD